eukprot:TRINITY_DN17578_c0_g1_i1.p1 TRINITY_DN17578_c0_g1~~TRINITY_DN17578_c0_g1_i1.p1  ORF type:complete len:429 (+),score=154.82 TRINITY_DN17578_c0_g1_i1:49-1287(+)
MGSQMDFLSNVTGDWWKVPQSLAGGAEMEVSIVSDGEREVCISGGMLQEIGRVSFVSEGGTRYIVGLPLAAADGGVAFPRSPYTTIAWTSNKVDAVRHARSKRIWVYVAPEEAQLEAALLRAGPPKSTVHIVTSLPYRPVAHLHGPDDTFVATQPEHLVGAVTHLSGSPPPPPRFPPFRVGTCLDYPPLTFLKEGVPSGLEVELLEACLRGGHVQWVKTSWPELHKGLLEGKYDAAFGGINESAKRRELFDVSLPVLPCAKCILTTKAKAKRFDRLSKVDKPGVVVVTNPGGTNAAFCKANFRHAQVRTAPDNKQPFLDLASGAADVMITDSLEALHRQQATHDSAVPLAAVCAESPLTTGHTVAIVRKDCPVGKTFLRLFNGAVVSACGKGALRILSAKWLGQAVNAPSKM